MEAVSYIFKVSLPNYLQTLPIPESFSGFAKLGYFDWVSLALFFHIVLLAVVAVVKLVLPKPPSKVNVDIKKEDPKVVDLVDVEDLSKEKVSYCRCWRSKEFPLCDGSHNDHNKNTRDNVGPLVVKCKKRK